MNWEIHTWLFLLSVNLGRNIKTVILSVTSVIIVAAIDYTERIRRKTVVLTPFPLWFVYKYIGVNH